MGHVRGISTVMECVSARCRATLAELCMNGTPLQKSGLRPGPLLYCETPNQSTTPVEHHALTRCARQPPEFQPEFYIVIHLVSKSRSSLRPLCSCYSISNYRQTCTQTLAVKAAILYSSLLYLIRSMLYCRHWVSPTHPPHRVRVQCHDHYPFIFLRHPVTF